MKRRRRKCTRFPGIVEDAERLGVNRATLYKMLSGYPGFGDLKALRRRYDALKHDHMEGAEDEQIKGVAI